MKFFKTTFLAGVLSINMAAPVFANQAPITEPIQQFTAADTQSLFEQDAKPMQLAALSQTEMKETEGAVAPIVVYGLMVGSRLAYVGITNSLARRTAQHAATKAFTGVRTLGVSNTRTGARVMEQNNINQYNTIQNGLNRINSISPSNPLSSRVTVPYRR